MRIRNRKSYFSSLPEGKAPVNKSKKVSSFIYTLIIVSIGIYFVYYVSEKFIFIEGRGQVEIGGYLINSDFEGTIQEMLVGKGDYIEKSQPLVKIQPLSNSVFMKNKNMNFEKSIQINKMIIKNLKNKMHGLRSDKNPAVSDKIIKINNDIRLKNIELISISEKKDLKSRLWNNSVDILSKNRLLELSHNSLNDYTTYKQEKIQSTIMINNKKNEIKSLKKYKRALINKEIDELKIKIIEKKSEINSIELIRRERNPGIRVLKSPISGYVQVIFKSLGGQFLPKESILLIRSIDAKVTIHSFFKIKYFTHLGIGKRVEITFPDNTKSVGIIKSKYSTASYFREKLREDYIPIKSKVLVELVPANSDEKKIWRKFDRMDVRIRIKK
ncbi:MAG: hypothetical protein GY760_28775 [Deltaproteobacteria bacterium]|nr:hypothetical protein [Deltaproteobacteria bacterium]